jgi:hypothetical protein
MQIFTIKQAMSLFISLVLVLMICVTDLSAQETIKVSGKVTYTEKARSILSAPDAKDHVVFISEWEGTNVSTGENKFMDGAQFTFTAYGHYTVGSGPHWTFFKMSLDGDMVMGIANGKTTTTLSPEKIPVTTLEGTSTFNDGKGKYVNIQGSVTYKVKYTSRTTMEMEWVGEYLIKK